jgi:signal transduction histidine kinase
MMDERALAHDLKAPLCTLRLHAEAARRAGRTAGGAEQALHHLDALLEQVAWMAEVLDARLGAERAEAVVEVHEFIQRAVARLRPLAEAQEAQLLPVCHVPGRVRIQPALAARALSNLLVNALEHGPVRGTIWVEVEQDRGPWLRLRVRDEGTPLEPGRAQALLQPGVRGPQSRGQGLGLAIAARAVSAHGGRLWVEPGVARGNTFAFTLPQA